MLTNLSLRNALYALFKYRSSFLAGLGLPLVLFCVFVLPRPSEYESAASLLIKVVDQDGVAPDLLSEQQSRSAASASNMAKQIIQSELMILTSEDVRRNALVRLGVDKVYPSLADEPEPRRMQVGLERLSKDFSAKISGETSVVMLSTFNPSPEIARRTLQELITATIEKQASVMRDPRLTFLTHKLDTLRIEVESAQTALQAYKKQEHITAFDEERSLLLKQRDEVESSLAELRAQLVSAEGRGKALRQKLAATPSLIATSDENDSMRLQLTQAHEQLAASRARVTQGEATGDVAALQANVQQAEQRYEELRRISMQRARKEANPISQRIDVDVSLAASEFDGVHEAATEREKQLGEINKRLGVLDGAEIKLRELERKRSIAETDYRSYLQRAQSARIVNDMNEAGITNLSVVQHPTLPHRPSRPRKTMLFALALLAGLVCGVGACIVRELFNDRPARPEDLEVLLGVPVLSSIRWKKPG